MANRLLALVAFAVLLAGCTHPGHVKTAGSSAVEVRDGHLLAGWVSDAAQLPVAKAHLRVEAANATAITNGDGWYGFSTLPLGEPLLVVADADGYKPLSKSVTLAEDSSLVLNFTLEAIPVKTPHVEMIPKKGLVSCQASVIVVEEEYKTECGNNDPNSKPKIEFTVGPDTAGIVLELVWEAGSPLAQQLNLTVETVGFGDQDQVLASLSGKSVLRAQVNSIQAARFYSAGGIVRSLVSAGSNPDEDESTVGVSVPLQQSFDLYVSVFYVEGPSPTYTALKN